MKPGRPPCRVSVGALVWPGGPSIAISPTIRGTMNMKGEGLEMRRVATHFFRWGQLRFHWAKTQGLDQHSGRTACQCSQGGCTADCCSSNYAH
jgi:hypothetical protein